MANEIQHASGLDKPVEYQPLGTENKIKLTARIVQNMLAVKTRSGKTCSEDDALKFVMLCVSRGLNPFEGDAFLIGFDGKDGPQFSLITAHQAFLKRAEMHPGYQGMDSGVIVKDSQGVLVDRQGDFFLDDDTLLGGWATVYVKDRRPMTRRLKLSTFHTGQSRWQKDPAGMIVKCAEADALRSSFPTKLGGMYLRDEIAEPPAIEAPPVGRVSLGQPSGNGHKEELPALAEPSEEEKADILRAEQEQQREPVGAGRRADRI
jgi:phage recombination protein Bet